MVRPIPDGFHSVNLHLVVSDIAAALAFYAKAFGAEEILRVPSPDGQIVHAEMRIGDSSIMLAPESPQMDWGATPKSVGRTTACICLYTVDGDALFARATQAGAAVRVPMADMFWGDRWGMVTDRDGHTWEIAQRVKDFTPVEMAARATKTCGASESRRA